MQYRYPDREIPVSRLSVSIDQEPFVGDGGAPIGSGGPAYAHTDLRLVPSAADVGIGGDGQRTFKHTLSDEYANVSQSRIYSPITVSPESTPRKRQRLKSSIENALSDVGRRENVRVQLSPATGIDLPISKLITKPTPSAESWKLAALVLVFLIWVSTAGTLLFLYMDRYLFG